MFEFTKLVATVCCGLFFGAALYISLVQHPAMLEAGSDFSARFFAPMYGRAVVMQAGLALVGCAAAITAWLMGAGRLWLAAAVLFGSVLPFTLLVIKPVNDILVEARDVSTPEVGALLIRWGHLHWARTVASGLALVASIVAIVRGKAWTAGRDAPC